MPCRTRVRTVAFALTALSSLSALVAFAAATGPSKGTAAAAKAIFTSKCIVCHKADGSGGVKLTGNATPNWKDPKLWADPKHNDDFLRDCITNGKVKSGMVAWGKTGQIKPEDIENLIAYIHVLKDAKAAPKAATPAKAAAPAPAKTGTTK
jgi:cytochrome c oxidase cbb3-type subunit III